MADRYQLRYLLADITIALNSTPELDIKLREIESRFRALPSAAGGLSVDSLYWSAEGVSDPDATALSAVEAVSALRRTIAAVDAELLRIRELARSLDIDDGLARS
ncbi:hypothetical protein [Nocardia sp. CS682]|uniref:hypothetical protein n=1 Tax=Nocardia sp. CS682 TaxID=1047172 RepID=UPI001074C586|nr:hypothetical protein [Nocardia sp. CS682]QBS43565.1 hypothetical protein DMB37_29140 [Nocardia sp. CS682]